MKANLAGATLALLLASQTGLVGGRAQAGVPPDLMPGHWYEVPDSRMDSVDPCPARDCTWSGTSGQHSVIRSWGGGAFDTRRNRLMVWGGGHRNYGGNELYAFDVDAGRWLRLTEPSVETADSAAYYPDGSPAARHTYGDVQYDPVNDSFVSLNAGSTYGNRGGSFRTVDVFDLKTMTWRRMRERPPAGTVFGNWSAYDPASGRFYYHGSNKGGRLQSWDPANDSWTDHTARGGVAIYMSAAVDTRRHRLVAVGAGRMYVYDLDHPDRAPLKNVSSGDQTINATSAPGLAYEPVTDQFVAWAQGAEVYLLDPQTWVWRVVPPAATNRVVPSPPAKHGTYGRFRYMPDRNAFILVNSTDTNVLYYRLGNDPAVLPAAAEGVQTPVPQVPARPVGSRNGPAAIPDDWLKAPEASDAETDWHARSGAPGVLMATRFDTASEVNDWAKGRATLSNVSHDTTLKVSGGGSLRFAVRSTDSTSSGNWRRYLADDKRQFGPGDEFFVQYRQYVPAYLIEHPFRGRNFGRYAQGFKSSIISGFRNSNTNFEVVIQNTGMRGYIQGYHQDGRSTAVKWDARLRTACATYDFVHQPAIDRGRQSIGSACENDRARYGGLYSYQRYHDGAFGDPDPLTGAFVYPKDQWVSILQRVRISPDGYTAPDNLIETWAAMPGGDYQLLVSDGAVRFGGGGRFDTLWLLNYRSKGQSDPDRLETFTNYDEVIVSTDFIRPPARLSAGRIAQ